MPALNAPTKQKMQRLEALTIAALASSDPGDYPDTSRTQEYQRRAMQQLREAPSTNNNPVATADTDVNFARVHALLHACTPSERQTFHVVKHRLIRLGYALDPQVFDRARHASTRVWLAEVLAIVGPDVGILAVLAAGIKLLAGFSLPEKWEFLTDGREGRCGGIVSGGGLCMTYNQLHERHK
ncbi:hypothetical protein F5B21DRAFT_504955 [Xylaria acuta]|nr:hypothetical protein F5B21DRAFT_504955 [Xylaria acuta]